MVMITLYAKQKETQMYRTDFGTLWEKVRVGCSERIALKQVYCQGWNRSSAQVGWMRQVLRAGALGKPRGMGWRGRKEGRSGWGTHVNPWLIHVNVWQKPLQYCKVISLQLIKINEKNNKVNVVKEKKRLNPLFYFQIWKFWFLIKFGIFNIVIKYLKPPKNKKRRKHWAYFNIYSR